MNRFYFSLALVSLIALTSGCANREGVAPSQNSSLNAVSPSGTATSQGGVMQRSLDSWLKEEWTPLTTNVPTVKTVTAPDGTVVQTKTEATQVVTTTTTPEGKIFTTTEATAMIAQPVDETPFTLQKYADKWKAYHQNQAKLNEGKQKETSNVEKLESMPAIGK